ncbi:hypothetical protein P152DRAFT_512942 [Eremomyces bilateralis CBS 781.70]|uniref:Uncharacterized protein n=1 Tax=Eremomyces bilateralis CBS 781.70 TaxID=1392243 RepID=A0A6G1G9A0_9PEZI|nr:uncharacterized protein P152DRAFT_512942 [Eremomyces bilateralis CBS 781.70]KAF1814614.1 hypothetical protein P152DRAFT_512942 [Eremomyces bilateralis CBS 781.70]
MSKYLLEEKRVELAAQSVRKGEQPNSAAAARHFGAQSLYRRILTRLNGTGSRSRRPGDGCFRLPPPAEQYLAQYTRRLGVLRLPPTKAQLKAAAEFALDQYNGGPPGYIAPPLGNPSLIVLVRVVSNENYSRMAVPENREAATVVEAVNAKGHKIPAALIMKGKCILQGWVQDGMNINKDILLRATEKAFSNDLFALDWIHHFESHTRPTGLLLGARYLPNCLSPSYDAHYSASRPYLFPTDEALPGKRYEYAVRQGITAYTKLEFLDGIGEVRQQALTEGTIRSGFRKAGIHPWDPEMVLKKIRLPPREAEQRPLTPPPEQSIQEGQDASPGLKTPTTVRATRRLGSFIQGDESIDQLCRGAQTQSLEAKKAMQDPYDSDLAKKMRSLNARAGNK